MSRPSVLLADDHTLLLEAFQKLLAEDCEVVGMVADGRALIAAAVKLRPDVVVVDVAMPLLNGLGRGAANQAAAAGDADRVPDDERGSRSGRRGISRRRFRLSAEAVGGLGVADGDPGVVQRRSYVTPLVTEGLVGSMMHGADSQRPAKQLTARQREVIQLLAEGHSMKEVAAILNIATRTVAFHKYRIMEQLQIKTTAELIQFAIKHHIV
jgi:DNA-binding NarL/FixJ family response regulator